MDPLLQGKATSRVSKQPDMNMCVWAVPLSSAQAPHIAHLVYDRQFTARLCRNDQVVTLKKAVPVDSKHYELKCRACAQIAQQFGIKIREAVLPGARTSRQVTLKRRHL